MLDKVILDHVSKIDDMEDELVKEVDAIIQKISVDMIVDGNVEAAFDDVLGKISDTMIEGYYPDAAKSGIEFAQNIKKDGSINIQKTKDPDANKEQVGDAFNDANKT